MSNSANARIKADVEIITSTSNFSELAFVGGHGALFVWVGQFSTEEDHPSQNPKEKTSKRINFSHPYGAAPTVVVWLNGLDVDRNANCRVKVYATDVSKDGFTIYIDSWADTKLYFGCAGWIAFSRRRGDICAGIFGTENVRPGSQLRNDNRSSVKFDKVFNALPKVFVALNALDFDKGKDLRVKVAASAVAKDKLDWSLESWVDSVFYRGGASFVAFDNSSI